MKYKLLKDLPGLKKGTILSEDKSIFGARTLITKNDVGHIEEIKEPVDSIHWKPKIGDRCFVLENTNIRPTAYTGMLRDYNAWRTGRVFRTKGDCEKPQTLSQTLRMAKVAGLSAMTTRTIGYSLYLLIILTTANLYATQPKKKLKGLSVKTEKIG